MVNKQLDDYLVQQIVVRLIQPFTQWPAYKYGIIDASGKVLKKKNQLRTKEENDSWSYLDILCCNLKKILASYPTTRMRLAQLNNIQNSNLPTTIGQPPTIPLANLVNSFFLFKEEILKEAINLKYSKWGNYHSVVAHDTDSNLEVGHVTAQYDPEIHSNPEVRGSKVRHDLRGTGLAKRMYDLIQLNTGRTLHPDTQQTDAAKGFWRKRYKENSLFHEDVAANAVGGGAIAGAGIGPQGEPGRRKFVMKLVKRKAKNNVGNN